MRCRRFAIHSLLVALLALNPVLSSFAWSAHLHVSASTSEHQAGACHSDGSSGSAEKHAGNCCIGGCFCHCVATAEASRSIALVSFGRVMAPPTLVGRGLKRTAPHDLLRPPIV